MTSKERVPRQSSEARAKEHMRRRRRGSEKVQTVLGVVGLTAGAVASIYAHSAEDSSSFMFDMQSTGTILIMAGLAVTSLMAASERFAANARCREVVGRFAASRAITYPSEPKKAINDIRDRAIGLFDVTAAVLAPWATATGAYLLGRAYSLTRQTESSLTDYGSPHVGCALMAVAAAGLWTILGRDFPLERNEGHIDEIQASVSDRAKASDGSFDMQPVSLLNLPD